MQIQTNGPIRCPRAQTGSSAHNQGSGDGFCGTVHTPSPMMTAPITASKGWSEASLNDSARDFVLARTGPDTEFGEVDGGNCGLTAYVLPDDKARLMDRATKEMCPGAETFQNLQFDPASQRMVVVMISEPEPRLFLCTQERASGDCKVHDEFKFLDGNGSMLSDATQEALIPASSGIDRDDDWNFQDAALAGSTPLDLGENAGRPFWWR